MPKSAAFAPSSSSTDTESGSGDILSKLPRFAQQYLRTLADSPNTRRNYLYALSEFFRVVPKDPVKVKILFKNPIPKFEWVGITAEDPSLTAIPATVSVAPTEITNDAVLGKLNRCIPWDDLPRILQAARAISFCQYLLFKIFVYTGIRSGELSTIRHINVRVDSRWVGTGVEPGNRKGNRKVHTEQDKHSKLQPYFLTEDLAEEVRQWDDQQELNYPAHEWLFPEKEGVGHIRSRTFDLWVRALSTKLAITSLPTGSGFYFNVPHQ